MFVAGVATSSGLGSICVQDGMSKQDIWAACGTMHTTAWRYFHFMVAVKPDITDEICMKVRYKGIHAYVSFQR